MTKEKMATLTEETESKLINALTDAFCLLKGSDLGNRIQGRAVIEKISDAINFFHAEKTRMENEKEWADNSVGIASNYLPQEKNQASLPLGPGEDWASKYYPENYQVKKDDDEEKP